MKKTILFLIILVFSSFTKAQKAQKALNNFLSLPQNRYAQIGLIIKDLTNDSVIVKYNTSSFLIPASLQKLLTTYCALQTFGREYKFFTDLYYSGFIKNSVLYGNLIVKGGGDPSFGSFLFNDTSAIENFVLAVKKLGIKHIKGNIIADASLFGKNVIPPKWTWEDLGNYYGAPPTSLCIYDNTYKIYFKTGSAGSKAQIISILPKIPNLKIRSNVYAARIGSDQSYIIGAPFKFDRVVIGRLPAYRKKFIVKGSIPDPALLFAQLLNQKLRYAGISVQGKNIALYSKKNLVQQKKSLITRHFSPRLLDIITKTNEKSINLYAEVLLNHLSLYYFDTVSTKKGISSIYKCLNNMGIDTILFDLYDGSGLSRYNNLTVKGLANFLETIYKQNNFKDFIRTLPQASVSGTLKYFGHKTVLEKNFFGKSGSMYRVRNYAGYYFAPNGHIIMIIIITNNFTTKSSQQRKAIEYFVNQTLM